MIWYACKKCGKRHGRPESTAGTLVFCECGHGNRVPWSSTAAEPEVPEAQPVPAARPLPGPRPAVPLPPGDPPPRTPELSRPRRRVPEFRKVNPAYCFNHDETPSEKTCADCRVAFCPACVVELQGRPVCGPCKNFRLRGLSRPARLAPLAVIALVVALASGPVAFCLPTIAVSWQVNGGPAVVTVVVSLVGMAFPVLALGLAWKALREIETKPHLGGRSLAMTGAATGLVGVLWSATVAALMIAKQFQG
jgi:hypothetical protein